MVTVVARYRARAGCGDAVAAVLARHVGATRREAGCVFFVACRDREQPDEFTLLEQYADEAALEEHRGSAHFQLNVLDTVVPLLEQRSARVFDEVLPEPS